MLLGPFLINTRLSRLPLKQRDKTFTLSLNNILVPPHVNEITLVNFALLETLIR